MPDGADVLAMQGAGRVGVAVLDELVKDDLEGAGLVLEHLGLDLCDAVDEYWLEAVEQTHHLMVEWSIEDHVPDPAREEGRVGMADLRPVAGAKVVELVVAESLSEDLEVAGDAHRVDIVRKVAGQVVAGLGEGDVVFNECVVLGFILRRDRRVLPTVVSQLRVGRGDGAHLIVQLWVALDAGTQPDTTRVDGDDGSVAAVEELLVEQTRATGRRQVAAGARPAFARAQIACPIVGVMWTHRSYRLGYRARHWQEAWRVGTD
jgi:hypothetical protein